MAKIGILGGTFNPPHNGHLLIAQEALAAFSLDEIWWIPTNIPPHKETKDLASNEARIEMIKRAISTNEQFALSLIEFEREGPSYTIDTIKELKKRHPYHDFFFIMGGDMLYTLQSWHKIDQLKQLVTFIGVNRQNYPVDQFENPYQVKLLTVPLFDISSSMIRERFATGKNTKYLVPDEVRGFIEESELYGAGKST